MARSLRDELLRAGLVTRDQAARAERGTPPSSKPAGGRRTTAHRVAKHATKRRARDASKPRLPAPVPVPADSPSAVPESHVRQINLEIRGILDTEAEKAGTGEETDAPFHFARKDRIKRIYVSEDQRGRLSKGLLAIVGFGGRHHLVPRSAGERVRELRPEVFVFIPPGEAGPDAVEEGYEGYEIPDGLVW